MIPKLFLTLLAAAAGLIGLNALVIAVFSKNLKRAVESIGVAVPQ